MHYFADKKKVLCSGRQTAGKGLTRGVVPELSSSCTLSKSAYEIAILPGDGIGREVIGSALAVMRAVVASLGLELRTECYDAGAGLYQDTGESISAGTMRAIGEADAILLGAMGLPDVRSKEGTEVVPQIEIREHYDLFASLRPVRLFNGVPPVLTKGQIDVLVIREITEGLFAGRHDTAADDPDLSSDRLTITRAGCERLFEVAFRQAMRRKAAGSCGHVTLFDKANVLRSMAFMRKIFDEVAADYPGIGTDRVHIDVGCMMLVTEPHRYDVVVTENQFGDIASEVAAGVAGGLGLAPSADIGHRHAVFQPCHGSAPDIAGKGVANPVATILSGAMLFEWLGEIHADARCTRAAAATRSAVARVLATGLRTRDLGGSARTDEITQAIVAACHSTASFGADRDR
jgi:3-isopropylmalate dehydrogenase